MSINANRCQEMQFRVLNGVWKRDDPTYREKVFQELEDNTLEGLFTTVRLGRMFLNVPMRNLLDKSERNFCCSEITIENTWDYRLSILRIIMIDSAGGEHFSTSTTGYDYPSLVLEAAVSKETLLPNPEEKIEAHAKTHGWLWFDSLPEGVLPQKLVFWVDTAETSADGETFEFTIAEHTLGPVRVFQGVLNSYKPETIIRNQEMRFSALYGNWNCTTSGYEKNVVADVKDNTLSAKYIAIQLVRALLNVPAQHSYENRQSLFCLLEVVIHNLWDHPIRIPTIKMIDSGGFQQVEGNPYGYNWSEFFHDAQGAETNLIRCTDQIIKARGNMRGWFLFDPLAENRLSHRFIFHTDIYDPGETMGWVRDTETIEFVVAEYALDSIQRVAPSRKLAEPQSTLAMPGANALLDKWLHPPDIHSLSRVSQLNSQLYGQGILYCRLVQNSEAMAAIASIEASLYEQDWDQAMRLLENAAVCIDAPTLLDTRETERIEFAKRILYYPFPELLVADIDLLKQFRARWSYITLLESSLISPGHWLLERELIAILLGQDYDIALDPNKTRTEPHSTSREERGRYCPAYLQMSSLAREGRRCMTYAIHCNFHGEVVSGDCLKEYLHDGYKSALDECIEAGLLSRELKPEHYLSHFQNDTLKAILRERGVKAKAKKDELAEALGQILSPEEMVKFVYHVMNPNDVRLPLAGAKKLRQMLHAEKERIAAWSGWLRYEALAAPATIAVLASIIHSSPSRVVDRPGPVVRFNEQTLAKIASHPVWKEYWDARCDEIVIELGNRLGWNAFKEAADRVRAYWGPAKSARFEADTHGLMDKLQIFDSEGAYNSFLELYCEARRRALGIAGPSPATKVCAECGQGFKEDSIPPGLAQLSGFHLSFCRGCLEHAFYDLIYAKGERTTSREDLIACLNDLCDALKQIPTAAFVKSPRLSMELDAEKAQRVIKALLKLPFYSTYTQEFGSWFKALIASGALSDEAIRTARGYKSVAADGHECLSLAERTIDDWLFAHKIPHEREPHYPFHPQLNPNEGLRADWKIGTCYIEYFGMLDDSEYQAKAEQKSKLAQAAKLKLIALIPGDILDLDTKLVSLLR